jgi:hypothetical protein
MKITIRDIPKYHALGSLLSPCNYLGCSSSEKFCKSLESTHVTPKSILAVTSQELSSRVEKNFSQIGELA